MTDQHHASSANGWDTVYAVQYPAVNQAIISQSISNGNGLRYRGPRF